MAKNYQNWHAGFGQSAKELKKGFRDGLPEDDDKDAKDTKKTDSASKNSLNEKTR